MTSRSAAARGRMSVTGRGRIRRDRPARAGQADRAGQAGTESMADREAGVGARRGGALRFWLPGRLGPRARRSGGGRRNNKGSDAEARKKGPNEEGGPPTPPKVAGEARSHDVAVLQLVGA